MRGIHGRSAVLLAVLTGIAAGPVAVAGAEPATQSGTGGGAATVDATATDAAVDVLRRGGNAVDATVAAAAVLGVTEPYSCGIGGGGFMVLYDAEDDRVRTIDSRETAPEAFGPQSLTDPATGKPLGTAEAYTSGLSTGVPGTVRGWEEALDRYGTLSLRQALRPGIRAARRGFEVDETFAAQTKSNADRFRTFTSTSALYLDGGEPPKVGSTLRNPGLADTYERIGRDGAEAFYEGAIARAIAEAVQRPPLAPGATRTVRPGLMTTGDLADYEARIRRPAKVGYRGLDVYGMAPPSSGGSTVGEALNILEGYDLAALPREAALHRYLEASRLAYADRGAFVADPEFFDVPLRGLLSDGFAAQRRALIGERAGTSPAAPGNPYPFTDDPSPSGPPATATAGVSRSGSTTHLTVSDDEGNVVAYTFTIEQTGGNGIVVPGRGFLLNNELTDFEFTPPAPNAPEGGKRPRSSISPTIVLDEGRPRLALGSPGGATIVTTVLQILVDRLALGATLPAAIAAPRLSQRNSATTQVEPGYTGTPEAAALEARGHRFTVSETGPEIGAAAAIEFLGDGRIQAAAEPERRGGGSARVVRPGG